MFNIALADVLEENRFGTGSYTLPAPQGETMVAVKITDMLGEEALVVERA